MENDLTPEQAREALASVSDGGRALADQVVTPWWYHPVLGIGAAGLIVSQALPGWWTAIVAVVAIAAPILLIVQYTRTHGVSFDRPVGRRTTVLISVEMAVLIAGLLVALVVRFGNLSPTWAIIAAVTVLVVTIVVGRAYDAALRHDLRAAA